MSFDNGDEIPTADLDPVNNCADSAGSPSHPESKAANVEDVSIPLPYSFENRSRSVGASRFAAQAADPAFNQSRIANRSDSPPVSGSSSAPGTPVDTPTVGIIQEIGAGSVLRGRYEIEHVVGIGGNSIVFQAVDRHRNSVGETTEHVAVKVLRPQLRNNPYALMRLRREFRQMQRLTHSGIARVFDLDCDGDVWFMTLELVEGQTITQWMKSPGSDAEAMRIITGCCEAVSYAHSRGIVHGDLKPSNVLVTPAMAIKLVDFGSAAAEASGATLAESARSFAATPPYASPQILTGNLADPRDDVFSLACIAYAVLTRGGHPFERKSSLDACQEQVRPAYSSRIQPRVFDVIVRALSWQRSNRHASASDFLSALIGNDLGRDLARDIDREPHQVQAVTAVTATAHHLLQSVAAQYPISPSLICSVPVTLDIPPSRRSLLPPQWLNVQPWPGAGGYAIADGGKQLNATNEPLRLDGSPDETACHWITPSLSLVDAPLVQVSRPESSAIEGELLVHSSLAVQPLAKRAARVYPTIWHRHGLAAVAVIGVLAILLGHESDVGSSTTRAELPPVHAPLPAPVMTTAATESIAIRETTGQASTVIEPNIVEHVVPPTPVPVAPGSISFDSETVHVGAGQSMAVLNVKRLDSTKGRARIAWTIEGASGRVVVDSGAIESQTIQFLDGQAVRSLYIPLLAPDDPGEHQPTRSFTVKLKKLDGSPSIGPLAQTTIAIASGQ